MKAGSGASWLVGILLLALVVGLTIYSYVDWPGARYLGIADKKFWDYLELLIVPAALAFGVYWLNRTQELRKQEADDQQQQRQQVVNQMMQDQALETVTQQQQDAALRGYLDQMSQLMLQKGPITEKPGSTLARARTLTVLPTLDADRKRSVLRFLYEAELIDSQSPVVDLTGADLRGADLRTANLSGADLSDVYLSGADLSGADLSGADLSGAEGITREELERQAYSLEGATMPDGQKYENWLKDNGHGADGENGNPS